MFRIRRHLPNTVACKATSGQQIPYQPPTIGQGQMFKNCTRRAYSTVGIRRRSRQINPPASTGDYNIIPRRNLKWIQPMESSPLLSLIPGPTGHINRNLGSVQLRMKSLGPRVLISSPFGLLPIPGSRVPDTILTQNLQIMLIMSKGLRIFSSSWHFDRMTTQSKHLSRTSHSIYSLRGTAGGCRHMRTNTRVRLNVDKNTENYIHGFMTNA
jgi:hypothetical protein